MTDNGNRTIHKLREVLNDHGSNLQSFFYGKCGCLRGYAHLSGRFAPVMFMFDRVGRVQVSIPETEDRDSKIEALLEAAGSAGGEDFDVLEDSSVVEVSYSFLRVQYKWLITDEYFCPPESLEPMAKAISSLIGGESVVSSEYIYRVKDAPGEIEGDIAETVTELKEALLEDADCVRVWSESGFVDVPTLD